MFRRIDILVILGLLGVLLVGCSTTKTISQVEDKQGPPAKVERRGDTVVYYYYFSKRGVRIRPFSVGMESGCVIVEFITDPSGKILKKRKYWKQTEIE